MAAPPPALRAVAAALDAGATIDVAIAALGAGAGDCGAAIRAGRPIGQTLVDAGLVEPLGGAVIDAGAVGGFLPAAFRTAADIADTALRRRRRMVTTIASPAGLVMAASLLLPMPLIVTDGVDRYLARALPGVLVVGVALAVWFIGWPSLRRRPSAAAVTRHVLRALARLPGIGRIVTADAQGLLLEMVSLLLGAGLSLQQALPLWSRAWPLSSTTTSTLAARQALARGGSLLDVIDGIVDDFPLPAVTRGVLVVAEQTGTLEAACATHARDARDESERRFATVMVVMAVVVGALVAVAIGAAIIQGYQGYFETLDRITAE